MDSKENQTQLEMWNKQLSTEIKLNNIKHILKQKSKADDVPIKITPYLKITPYIAIIS